MDNRLVIPISDLALYDKTPIDADVAEDAVRPPDAASVGLARVEVRGDLSGIDREFLFAGEVAGVFDRPCDRCLQPARKDVRVNVSWFFEPGSESAAGLDPGGQMLEFSNEEDVASERVRYFEGDAIDLGSHVWEELVVNAPSKFLCRDDCKGLCPECGANLNEQACECTPTKETAGHAGFAGLREMFPDLPSRSVED